METLFIPTETEFKKWIRDVLSEYFAKENKQERPAMPDSEYLLTRKEAAALLQVSLVTLTDWMKRGLPYHKVRGRVYLIRSEVLSYLGKN